MVKYSPSMVWLMQHLCNLSILQSFYTGLARQHCLAVAFLSRSYKLQVLRIRSRAFACLSLCSSVRKLEKNRSGS
jgi:hypothetical protein